MLIRSQSKNALVNMDMIFCINIRNYADLCILEVERDERVLEIGTYKSEEKALKVLDMIQAHYNIIGTTFQMPTNAELDEQEPTEITETEKDLKDALNTVNNYKKMLFGE